jgi:hypothetical protein
VLQIREAYPDIDVVGLPTATGPLYHLVVALISGPLDLSEAGTQIAGALFAAALAALGVWNVQSVPSLYLRTLAVSPLLFSAYFWESALWMLTDDAAILFTMAALILLGRDLNNQRQVAIGMLIAGAIATRQTSVWALVPAVSVFLYSLHDRSCRSIIGGLARLGVPGVAVLVVLTTMWGGLTPPAGQANASSQSWTSISFVFAVAACFAVPVFIATLRTDIVRGRICFATIVGLIVALPAIVFESSATSFPDDSRRGGVLWSVVAEFPDVSGRSLILAVLSFVGGFVCTVLFYVLNRRTAIMLASSTLALASAMAPGAQLYQRYAELPIAMMVVLTIVALANDQQIRRFWPILCLVAYQAFATVAIVVVPIVRASSS